MIFNNYNSGGGGEQDGGVISQPAPIKRWHARINGYYHHNGDINYDWTLVIKERVGSESRWEWVDQPTVRNNDDEIFGSHERNDGTIENVLREVSGEKLIPVNTIVEIWMGEYDTANQTNEWLCSWSGLVRLQVAYNPLLPGESVDAFPVVLNPDYDPETSPPDEQYVADDQYVATIRDELGNNRGRPKSENYGVPGSVCVARFDSEDGVYNIVAMQPMVQMILIDAVVYGSTNDEYIDLNPDTAQAVQPIGAVINQFPTQAHNINQLTVNDGDTLLVFWNEVEEEWFVWGLSESNDVRFGQLNSTFDNTGWTQADTITFIECAWDGTNLGETFEGCVVDQSNKSIALFAGNVYKFEKEKITNKWITTGNFDDLFGTIKMVATDSAIAPGWEVLNNYNDGSITWDTEGRVPVDIKSGLAYGDTGGTSLTDLQTHTHDDHPATVDNCLGGGIIAPIYKRLDGSIGSLDHSEEDVRPPYFVVKFIIRTS